METKTDPFTIISQKENQSKTSETLTFYSFHDCVRIPEESDYVTFKKTHFKNINYPCLILIRYNGWNDFGYFTHFNTLYLPNEQDIIPLGDVKIIQSGAMNFNTNLPTEFKDLSKNKFFSRGTLSFYKKLRSLGELKNTVLSALNDIHYHDYTKEHISNIDGGCLLKPYEDSLFRDDFYDLEVSSEYAKDSLEMLDKISGCVTSLSTLDEPKQEVIRKLLYGSVITSLEIYLGDAFKYHVINNKSYFYSFLKNYEFPKGEKKYNLKELSLHGNKIGEFIVNKVKEIMNNIIFHKLELVDELYRDILNINLPSTWIDFQDAIKKRHDIFHRNGKNIVGNDLNIQSHEVSALITQVKKFISEMELIMNAQI